MTKKIEKAYNNELLKEALKERDETIENLSNDMNGIFMYDDDEKERMDKFKKLSQFEQDLIYLISTGRSIIEISSLYCVSRTHIYNQIKKIQEKLKK